MKTSANAIPWNDDIISPAQKFQVGQGTLGGPN